MCPFLRIGSQQQCTFDSCCALPAVAGWDLHVRLLEAGRKGKAGGAKRTPSLVLAAVGFYLLTLLSSPNLHLYGRSVVPAMVLVVSSLSISTSSAELCRN